MREELIQLFAVLEARATTRPAAVSALPAEFPLRNARALLPQEVVAGLGSARASSRR